MPGPSRQFAHLQQQTLDRLRAHIPEGCPLTVEPLDVEAAYRTRVGFKVTGPGCEMTGRMQVALAFIDGYARAWEHIRDREQIITNQLQQLGDLRRQLDDASTAAKDMAGKIHFLVNHLDRDGQLEEHVFTFPDGDVWEAGH